MVVFLSVPLNGQLSTDYDTIKIKEVVIGRHEINLIPAGYKKKTVDSAILADYSNSTLSEMLAGQSAIFVKSYGLSGVSSLSFRGTGASQTLIDWNGINLNSPMLGQTDLSLIQVGLIDDIQVYYGGASMVLNTGGIGGTINLETKPIWKKETNVTLNTGIGSFGEYSGLVKVKTGNTQFQSVTKGYITSSKNNFRYLDYLSNNAPFWMTRSNSQVSQRGFIQELYYKYADNVASARVWYQSSDRNLPPTLQSEDFKEKQFDESLRIMLNDNVSGGKANYLITGAFLLDKLNYTNQRAKIDSRNLSETFIIKAERESHPGVDTKLKMSMNNELCFVKTNNYDQNVIRNTASLTASLERECIDRLDITILLREILVNKTILIPDFSTAIQYRLMENTESYLKASISRNSRIPTMNELYYSVYGNPDLKNEYAFIYELTYEMKQEISSTLNIKSDLSVFHNSIKDMIQWQPGAGTLTVDNIKKVNASGLESSVSMVFSSNKFTAQINASYSLTKSIAIESYLKNDATTGKQLMYIPVNQANSIIRLSYGNFYSSLGTSLTGTRFTTTDHSRLLPYYILNNTITGIKLPLQSASIDISFHINNLFDINYQSIAYYPLPGRSYNIKVLVQLFK